MGWQCAASLQQDSLAFQRFDDVFKLYFLLLFPFTALRAFQCLILWGSAKVVFCVQLHLVDDQKATNRVQTFGSCLEMEMMTIL